MQSKNLFMRGFTLIELMISMIISLLLISIVLKIFLSSQKIFAIDQDLTTLQNNASILQHIIQSEIRLAGYIGCNKLTSEFPILSNTTYRITVNQKITGTSSSLTIMHESNSSDVLVNTMSNPLILSIQNIKKYKSGDILLISDCKSADIFQVAHVISSHFQEIMATKPLSHCYATPAQVAKLEINHLYLVRNADSTSDLILEDMTGRKTHLLSDIKKLNFTYTINRNEEYQDVNADEIKDWSKVVGILTEVEFTLHKITQNWSFYTALR